MQIISIDTMKYNLKYDIVILCWVNRLLLPLSIILIWIGWDSVFQLMEN